MTVGSDDDVFQSSIRKRGATKAGFTVPAPNLRTFGPGNAPYGPVHFQDKILDIGLFSGFESARTTTQDLGPFEAQTAFEPQDRYSLSTIRLNQNSFADITSTSSTSSYEHLSASVGVGVDCAVFGGSVSVSYDKYVSGNTDNLKHSQHAVCVDSIVRYETPPSLAKQAKRVLAEQGESVFRSTYGDFFVSGFVLGAEAGLLMSYDHSFEEDTEITSFTITVKVLFWSASHTETQVDSNTVSLTDLKFSSFNTLTQAFIAPGTTSGSSAAGDESAAMRISQSQSLEDVKKQIAEQTLIAQNLPSLLAQKKSLLTESVMVTFDQGATTTASHSDTRLAKLQQSDILFRVQLSPYTVLREYQEVLNVKR